MDELEAMFARLLETARKLPPGPDRHEALKEIGLMRQRFDTIAERLKVKEASRRKNERQP